MRYKETRTLATIQAWFRHSYRTAIIRGSVSFSFASGYHILTTLHYSIDITKPWQHSANALNLPGWSSQTSDDVSVTHAHPGAPATTAKQCPSLSRLNFSFFAPSLSIMVHHSIHLSLVVFCLHHMTWLVHCQCSDPLITLVFLGPWKPSQLAAGFAWKHTRVYVSTENMMQTNSITNKWISIFEKWKWRQIHMKRYSCLNPRGRLSGLVSSNTGGGNTFTLDFSHHHSYHH